MTIGMVTLKVTVVTIKNRVHAQNVLAETLLHSSVLLKSGAFNAGNLRDVTPISTNVLGVSLSSCKLDRRIPRPAATSARLVDMFCSLSPLLIF